ncbi:FRG domain-containing protein [Salmonirosea aquatica]|uniref:FRG domain-containing protein n=1 Tax=Salmonirosea aquatica TaxID=2654236 RepID=A0A7C9BLK1_9BACT|nr:FRG domain-containing protein [Cytophagaceae bacterium SJW1-29]
MIISEKQLLEEIDCLRNKTPQSSLLLYRGQTQLYEKMRSGKARPNTFVVPEVENGWNTIVNRLTNENSRNSRYNQAILQHYGFPTYYLDLTSDPLIAAWFAVNEYTVLRPTLWIGNTFRFQEESTYTKLKDGIGFLIIIEIPNFKEMIARNELFDISHEQNFIRPQKQAAYLMLDQPPRLPNPNDYIAKILEIDRSAFDSSKNIKELFPKPTLDNGYASLLKVPFVQMPSYYVNKTEYGANISQDEISIDLDKNLILGRRAIHIPLYVEYKMDLSDFRPNWKDTVIYEPSQFRLWKTQDFDLSKIHSGQNVNFKDSAKITISPLAFNKLFDYPFEIELTWPDINSNSIFFTKAVIDHDKIIDHEPPYLGVWLYKKDNLIFELHLIVDDERAGILIELGHVYIFEDGQLEYVKVEKECSCGNPEEHYELLQGFLKIHSLVRKQEVALIQNSFMIDKWYVLL